MRTWLIVVLTSLLALPLSLRAGNWHVAGSLECNECHLQHGTDENGSAIQDAFGQLLKKNSVNELCLSCHDGTDASAPDVLAPTPMYGSTASQESGAGVLTIMGVDNPSGHTIGLEIATPLSQNASLQNLTCVSCHAAHGNGNYRNLLQDPASSGALLEVKEGVQILTGVRPDNPPSANGSVLAYSRDNIGYVSGLSAWCTTCHDQLASNSVASAPAHFNAHPSNVAFNANPFTKHVDIAHWIGGTGEGFSAVGQTQATLRVPFLSAPTTDFRISRQPAADNLVSCESCHKAHGSANRKAMIWPYLEGGGTSLDGCQQCHNK